MNRVIICLIVATFLLSSKVFPDSPASYQKPGAPVYLLTNEVIQLDPYSEKSVVLKLSTPQSGELMLRAKASDGIIIDQQNVKRIIDLTSGQPDVTLELQSLAAGRFHIMFHAELANSGTTVTRAFGVAVQVGPEAAQAASRKPSSPYVIMQGQESVR